MLRPGHIQAQVRLVQRRCRSWTTSVGAVNGAGTLDASTQQRQWRGMSTNTQQFSSMAAESEDEGTHLQDRNLNQAAHLHHGETDSGRTAPSPSHNHVNGNRSSTKNGHAHANDRNTRNRDRANAFGYLNGSTNGHSSYHSNGHASRVNSHPTEHGSLLRSTRQDMQQQGQQPSGYAQHDRGIWNAEKNGVNGVNGMYNMHSMDGSTASQNHDASNTPISNENSIGANPNQRKRQQQKRTRRSGGGSRRASKTHSIHNTHNSNRNRDTNSEPLKPPFRMSKFSMRNPTDPQWDLKVQDEAELALSWCVENVWQGGIFSGLLLLDRISTNDDLVSRPSVHQMAKKIAWASSRTSSPSLAKQLTEVMGKFLLHSGACHTLDPEVTFGIRRSLLNCWSKLRDVNGTGKTVHRAFLDLKDAATISEHNPLSDAASACFIKRIDSIVYNQVINALANDGEVELAVSVLEEMIHNPIVPVDRITFNTILKAIFNSNEPDTMVKMSDTIVTLMHHLNSSQSHNTEDGIRPDIHTHNMRLAILAKSSHPRKAHKACQILDEVEKLRQDDSQQDPRPYKKVFVSILKLLTVYHAQVKDADRALRCMVEAGCTPPPTTFNAVINCWAKSNHNNPGKMASDLLTYVKQHRRDFRSDVATITILLNAFAKGGHYDEVFLLFDRILETATDPDLPDRLKPNKLTFMAVLRALAKSNRTDAGERANKILLQMQSLHNEYGIDCKPDTIVFNAAINCWAKSNVPEAGHEAGQLLHDMKQLAYIQEPNLQPDSVTFNAVIHAHATAKNNRDATYPKIADILDEMTTMAENGQKVMRPSKWALSAVKKIIQGDKNAAQQMAAALQKFRLLERVPELAQLFKRKL